MAAEGIRFDPSEDRIDEYPDGFGNIVSGAYTPGTQRVIGLWGGGRTRNVGWGSVAGSNRNRMADGKSVKANQDFFHQRAQDLLALFHIQRLRTCTQFVAKSTQALG